MTTTPIVDLHSDLLTYLVHQPGRTPEDSLSRNSYSQLKEGGCKLQTLAIFSITGNKSVEIGLAQVSQFKRIFTHYPTLFSPCVLSLDAASPQIQLLPAIENASSFALETEPLSNSLKRLEEILQAIGPLFYISLTWNHENRFGGGDLITTGLKEDGKRLLHWMSGKKIAIDLSHASDKLSYDILNFIDQQALAIPVLASHSNFRSVTDHSRNLPEEIAKEIIRRKGLIGLNFFAPFIHESDPSVLVRHVEYALSLGAESALCFGADFFCDADFPDFKRKYHRTEAFYPGLDNSSVYPSVLKNMAQRLHIQENQLRKIAYENALHFLEEQVFFK
jgi:membrane dipeptidase